MKKQDYEQLTLFPEDFHVSLSALPGSERARMMTASSGRKCAELYGNYGPLGSLVKMCLGSSIWHSTKCLLIWKTKATPLNRLLFRLAVSMPRINGNECAFWPTPTASSWGSTGHKGQLRKMMEQGKITEEEFRGLTAGNEGRINPELAEWMMGYRKAFTQLIPTVRACEYKGASAQRFIGGVLQTPVVRTNGIHSAWSDWPGEPGVDRVVHGIPNRVDRVRALGNAVVPQQFYIFFKLIADITGENKR